MHTISRRAQFLIGACTTAFLIVVFAPSRRLPDNDADVTSDHSWRPAAASSGCIAARLGVTLRRAPVL
jgi:hypothetical protein